MHIMFNRTNGGSILDQTNMVAHNGGTQEKRRNERM